MTMKTEPFLSGKWGWELGEGDWKNGADENFLKFSYMLNGNVDGFVSTLPASPLDGSAYFLTSDNTLNARVEGVWRKFPTPKGFVVTEKATGSKYEFSGSAFVQTLTATDKTKLTGIATGATVNSSDASLRDRTTHTGTQAISTVVNLQSTLDSKAPTASPTFTGTPTAPTVTTSDSSTKLATTAWVNAQGYSKTDPPVTSVAGKTGTVTLVKGDVGLGNVDNTADVDKPVSTATQAALNAKAGISNPTFTGAAVLPANTTIGSVSPTEISYVLGATSNLQAQINSLSGGGGGYAPIFSPSFTGTVSGVTKAMVGLSNVDNTSDTSKPISTATQSALNAKQNTLSGSGFVKSAGGAISYDTTTYSPLNSPTFTGTVTLPNATSIGGVSSVKIGYLTNLTSDVQVQINTKATVLTPSFTDSVLVTGTTTAPLLSFSHNGSASGTITGDQSSGLNISNVASITATPTTQFNVVIGGVNRLQLTSAALNLGSTNLVGDFSNTTLTSRSLLQTSTNNGVSSVGVIPNGSATTSEYVSFNNSTPTNSSFLSLTATGSLTQLVSGKVGTGTYLPLHLSTGGANRISIFANGNVGVGTSTDAGYKLDVSGTSRFTGDMVVNALSGNSSISLSQAGTVNGKLFASGGGGNDVGILSGRHVVAQPAGAFMVNIGGTDRLTVNSTTTVCSGTVISNSVVSSNGFLTTTFSAGVRNPIWRFGNADGFGLSYFQGTAGVLGDVIGIHFGTPTAVSSQFLLKQSGMLRCTGYQQTAQILGNVGGGNVYVDLNQGNHIMATAVGACNWIFLNGPEGGADSMEVKLNLTNGGNYTQTFTYTLWPSGVLSLTPNGTDVIELARIGGYPWHGRVTKDLR